jgi:flagellar assembly protein FliH
VSRNEAEIRALEYPAHGGARPALIDLQAPVSLADRVRELETQLETRGRGFAREMEIAAQAAEERGRRVTGGEQAAWRQECIAQLKTAVDAFVSQRDEYFTRVEHEVVRLALGIAERILHREAQLDPLLLSGAVRVALGQLAESTKVRLRVPVAQKEMWAEMVRLMPGLPLRPEVEADDGLKECEAVMEASLGAADLSVKAQLSEIERSFFDVQESATGSAGAAGPEAADGKRG